jgi:hypothetical protein
MAECLEPWVDSIEVDTSGEASESLRMALDALEMQS